MRVRLDALALIVRPVRNIPAAAAFYRDALGFLPRDGHEEGHWTRLTMQQIAGTLGAAWGCAQAPQRWCILGAGDQSLALVECADLPPADPDSGANDVRFQHIAVVVNDMDAAWRRLLRCDPALRCVGHGGPQKLPPAAGGVIAVKFRDADGHPVELIAFPPETSHHAWQSAASQASAAGPTIGIDHSAISIASADASIHFYRDQLGLCVAQRQTNSGEAQAQLDGVPDPRVEVVALQVARHPTPHLELLGYQQPAPVTGMARASARTPRTTLVWYAEVTASGEVGSNTVGSMNDPDGHLHVWLPGSAAATAEANDPPAH